MARHGRHGAPPSRCPRTVRTGNSAFRVFTKHETRDTNHGFFSNHSFPAHDFPPFPAISRHFPAFPGPPPPPSADQVFTRRPPFLVSRPGLPPPPGRCFPARCGAAWAAMARHGRPPSPAPSTRPVGFLQPRDAQHAFPQSLRRSQGEQPKARPTVFHESRNTRHETRLLFFPTRHFSRFPGISHYFSGVGGAPEQVFKRRCGKIPQKCTKSRIPQENARSTAFAAAPATLRAPWATANTK